MIDLRSDTVTVPCEDMRRAMAAAEVGDDVYGEDPTAARLEQQMAEMSGHEAGLFFPSGTQSNLVALMCHCQRGDEYIVGQNAHTYKYEAGGAAVLGSIQPQPLDTDRDGTLPLAKIEAAIKQDDIHFARTRLLALENTIGGRILPLDYVRLAGELASANGLVYHLDGARAFNAAVGLGVELRDVTAGFDSVSICLSKGLGAPVGSVLCAHREVIEHALRWRKMVGGGMRQIGILAAAGLFALENNVQRLQQDHELADMLAEKLMQVGGVEVIGGRAHTNMVFFSLPNHDYDKFVHYTRDHGLLLGGRDPVRLVTHKDVSKEDIKRAVAIISGFFH